MKIVTMLLGMPKESELDRFIRSDTIQDLFQFTIKEQAHRDFFEGYCLVNGIHFPIVEWDPVTCGLNYVEITFPELELHCDSTGDSP